MRIDRGQWRDLPLHPDDLHQERQGVEVAGETGDDKNVHPDDLHVDFYVNDFHVDFIVDDLQVRIVHVYVDDLHQERQGVEDWLMIYVKNPRVKKLLKRQVTR